MLENSLKWKLLLRKKYLFFYRNYSGYGNQETGNKNGLNANLKFSNYNDVWIIDNNLCRLVNQN